MEKSSPITALSFTRSNSKLNKDGVNAVLSKKRIIIDYHDIDHDKVLNTGVAALHSLSYYNYYITHSKHYTTDESWSTSAPAYIMNTANNV